MKKLFVTLALATVAVGAFAQGSLTYQSTLGVGKEKYIFQPNPSAPTVAKNGGALADYAGFAKVEGTGYSAELYWAAGENAAESSLKAVAGSLVGFRTGTTAGLIAGKSKLDIAGTLGGDKVTLQLRVWNNQGGTVTSWDQAVEKGASNLFTHELAGVDGAGSPKLGTGSIANGLTYFSLTVPEPSVVALGALGLGALLLRRRK